jgi:2Fe-2S ferredoxin
VLLFGLVQLLTLEEDNYTPEIKILNRASIMLLALFFFVSYIKIMSKITYIENNGKEHKIEVSNGLTVMEGAVQNNISGIDADCGGSMACATCHVYVKEEWFNKLPKKEDGEEDMLDMAYEPNKFSRLSCQITVTDDLDGLIVELPTKQS